MKMLAQIKIALVATGVAAAVALALVVTGFAGDGKGKKEEKIRLGDCPAAVQQTIKDNAAGGEILQVEKETAKDGTVVYEAEVKKSDGNKVEIEVAEDGRLIEIEEEDDDDDDDDDDDKKEND